jgi:hypothetical protein
MTEPLFVVAPNVHSEHDALVAQLILASGLRHECSASWSTDVDMAAFSDKGSDWRIVASSSANPGFWQVVAAHGAGSLLLAGSHGSRLSCRVFARSADEGRAQLVALRAQFPEMARSEPDTIFLTFWTFY